MISGNHSDVITIEPSGVFIKIDQVRSLRKQLLFAPIHGGRRVIIVNDAHKMNAEASNAMLKMLEEPPDNTHIVLTAPQTSDLLPTIVSRCQHVAFRPLHPTRIAAVLRERVGLDEDTAMAIAVLAKGSLGKALFSDTNQWMDWRRDLLERIGSISDVSTQTLFAFAEALARDKDRLQDAMVVIMVWFRDLLMCKFHPDKILNRDFMEEIHRTSRGFSVDDLFERILAVFATQRAILRNANRRLALEVMMMRLCSTQGRHNTGLN
jgi:DNA polymerase-3 subunit delta'